MPVDHLETRLRRSARPHQDFKFIGYGPNAEATDILCIDSVSETELLAHGNLCRRIGNQLLGRDSYHSHAKCK